MFSSADQNRALELLEAIHFFSVKNWSPATSTNYSVRSTQPGKFIISRSGVDKSRFAYEDLILIDGAGQVDPAFAAPGVKSSAETDIHTALYRLYPEVECVLHTHSVAGTVLSMTPERELRFTGLEILKGLEGNATHELTEVLPIVPNSQDMGEILSALDGRLAGAHGFLIKGHGLYTWGKDIASAKRHIETYEFLFECELKLRS
jgi:methylthioribulose-1-phosphate dehydratase